VRGVKAARQGAPNLSFPTRETPTTMVRPSSRHDWDVPLGGAGRHPDLLAGVCRQDGCPGAVGVMD